MVLVMQPAPYLHRGATFLTYYYTDVMGLAAGAIGTMMLIARILDAFLDVGVGIGRQNEKQAW